MFACIVVRERSDEVMLNGMKITSTEGDQAMGSLRQPIPSQSGSEAPTILFLHGLMG